MDDVAEVWKDRIYTFSPVFFFSVSVVFTLIITFCHDIPNTADLRRLADLSWQTGLAILAPGKVIGKLKSLNNNNNNNKLPPPPLK